MSASTRAVTTANEAPKQATICRLFSECVAFEPGEFEANASLIAAAPDLLAALHLARIAINADALADSANNGSSWFEARAVALAKIDAAISKAEGRA